MVIDKRLEMDIPFLGCLNPAWQPWCSIANVFARYVWYVPILHGIHGIKKTKPPLKFSNFTGENHGENDDRLTSGFRGTLKSESLAPGRGRQSTYPVIKCGWRIPWGPRDSNGWCSLIFHVWFSTGGMLTSSSHNIRIESSPSVRHHHHHPHAKAQHWPQKAPKGVFIEPSSWRIILRSRSLGGQMWKTSATKNARLNMSHFKKEIPGLVSCYIATLKMAKFS